jgi:hypothetical protein
MSSIHNEAVIEQIAEALAEEFNRDPTEVEVETAFGLLAEVEKRNGLGLEVEGRE